ncbi:hypothetical protein ACFOEE_19225 [Pseudoalteromonas fenneropenaei]|uniref:DUF1311 domain-containing protein n=2 Tax=Pseudoalteromonas fenneropenaei TaxID=1737459 RepID=A0ABV7CPQ2_9GAMM
MPLVLFGSSCYAVEGLRDCAPLASEQPEKAKKYIQCLDQNIEKLKQEEQIWYQKLTLDIQKIEEETGNTQLLPIIRRSAIKQKEYLEDSCRWRFLHQMPNPTKAAIAYKQCEISLLQSYLDALQMPY